MFWARPAQKRNSWNTAILNAPHCGRAFIIVRQLLADTGDQIRYSFRHFPLAKMHPHARKAAEAAEAAGAQGKFWEMHDLLFKNAQEWRCRVLCNMLLKSGSTPLDLKRNERGNVFGSGPGRCRQRRCAAV